ncbi:MAG TPA: DedA family protein [Allosphingosinicella sp.]|jgi:membrane protein DedA with SNARE-associated domain
MFDWIVQVIESGGYSGIALLMLLAILFPPLPSELIMPMAGFDAARGEFDPFGVIAAGTIGTVVGTIFWYSIGRLLGLDRLKAWSDRHGRWLTLHSSDFDAAARWFDDNGAKAVLLGRILPAIRTLVSIAAGIFAMGFGRFLLFSTLGSILWNAALTGAGYMLESRYAVVGAYLNPATNAIFAVIAGYYFYRLATWRPA